MKNTTIKSLAVLMMLAMLNLIAFAQDGRERVQFARGKASANTTRTVSADSGVITFILNARKGQRMQFTVDSDVEDLGITLSEAGKQDFTLESETGEPNEFIIKKTGDHYITVVNHSDTKAEITLRVNIK